VADIDWKGALTPGYYPLGDSQIAAIVTFLEMRAPSPPRAASSAPLNYERFGPRDASAYRALYRAVGEQWGWFSRLAWSDAAFERHFSNDAVSAFHVTDNGGTVGIVELDARAESETELAFFGVIPGRIGAGFAATMMDFAIARAFSRPIARFFVHTCTLDHPAALRFYEKSGFKAYQRAVEIAQDPRVAGLLPGNAFPHFPPL
jgi:ribosomal protein S18 acetylase RimI-like enzyme